MLLKVGTRVLALVAMTFVLIILLSQLALTAASTRFAAMIAWTDFGLLHPTGGTIEPWQLRAAGLVATQGILELAGGE